MAADPSAAVSGACGAVTPRGCTTSRTQPAGAAWQPSSVSAACVSEQPQQQGQGGAAGRSAVSACGAGQQPPWQQQPCVSQPRQKGLTWPLGHWQTQRGLPIISTMAAVSHA